VYLVRSETTAIAGGRLVDGLGGDPIDNAVIVVEDGRVSRVGPASTTPVPRGARVLDAAGMTVLPGIIDCHVHSTYRARNMTEHLRTPPTYNVLRSLEILRETLACGVTTCREMGGADPGFRRAIDEGLVDGPRLLVAIVMVSQSGGHGDTWVPAGFRVPKRSWSPSGVADGADAVRKLVRELLMAGADFIKVCTSGGITSVTDDYDEPQMTVDEIRAAVEEAAARRKRVAAHAEGLEGIRRALDGGVYSVEHGWFVDEECVQRMLDAGTWWVPTLGLVALGVERRRQDAGGTWSASGLADEQTKEETILRLQQEQIPLWRDAIRRGLKVAMGTDQSHRLMTGENLRELRFMRDWLGMDSMEVLVASTRRAAECLERDDIGTLEPGKVADVLAVEGDPLDDITVLEDRTRLRLIMQAGRPFRSELPASAPAEGE
jgi:imidazolonepropionase-like amidohydrolase